MLRDRYQPVDLFALVPQLGLRFEPQLEQLDSLLDDDELFRAVREDLARRHPMTRTRGRPSTPAEVILRMLVVMRLYGWSFERAEFFVNDSLVLRQFCRVYLEKVPDASHTGSSVKTTISSVTPTMYFSPRAANPARNSSETP
jgi:IS5 family transposase